MCGRFLLRTFPEEFTRSLKVAVDERLDPASQPRFNIAPSQPIVIARPQTGTSDRDNTGDARQLHPVIWGLIPHWMKERPSRGGFINARAETVFEKPSFRAAARYRRCLIPADGFYEWRTTASGKTPYLFERPDSAPFCFAGIWDHWTAPDGSEIDTAAVLTTGPNAVTQDIHDRMPVILPPEAWDTWTHAPAEEAAKLKRLLRPAADDVLTSRPVSRLVNNVRNDGPELLLGD